MAAQLTTATVKRPGPPVPPRPLGAAGLLRSHRDSLASPGRTKIDVGTDTPTMVPRKPPPVVLPPSMPQQQQQQEPSPTSAGSGRTIIYKSPSMSLPQRPASAPKPALKHRRAPDVPTPKPRTPDQAASPHEVSVGDSSNTNNNNQNDNNNTRSAPSNVSKISVNLKSGEEHHHHNNNAATPPPATPHIGPNNVVIVHSTPMSGGGGGGVSLNRHNSMSSPPRGNTPPRLSLSRTVSEKVNRIQLDQLPLAQPLPKPRKIVKVPVATLDLEGIEGEHGAGELPPAGGVSKVTSLFRRSKTTLDSLAARASVTTVNSCGGGGGIGGSDFGSRTSELKNNLKNAAERLFSEIMVSQQRQATPTPTKITKHERAIQHPNGWQMDRPSVGQLEQRAPASTATTTPTRVAPVQPAESGSARAPANENSTNSPEKKTAFHEILISEIAAMRAKSSSMENLRPKDISVYQPKDGKVASATRGAPTAHTANKAAHQKRQRCNSVEDHDDPDTEDVDDDNVEDAEGDDHDHDDLSKTLKTVTLVTSPRKRCPSGCSSDSSPYGTERSARIRTSDWIEVGDNGKAVTLTSCHISLEDSGMEDEERLDDVSSSGVGDSWDSVKEAENEKRSRSVKRVMSFADLPPLPKSLSGINQMLGADSGLHSDADGRRRQRPDSSNQIECRKDNDDERNANNNNDSGAADGSSGPQSKIQQSQIEDNNNNNKENDDKSEVVMRDGSDEGALATEATGAVAAAYEGSTLDKQLALLKKEMFGLRQLDLSLLSQLWALNDSLQEFRTMIEQQEPGDDDDDDDEDDDEDDDDDEVPYTPPSHTPSSYESASSGGEEEQLRARGVPKRSLGAMPKVITKQPALSKSRSLEEEDEAIKSGRQRSVSTSEYKQQAPSRPPPAMPPAPPPLSLPRAPVDGKPVPRMRTAPPPPPAHRKQTAAPPRPT